MDQRPSIEELKNLEKEKSTRFIAIKNWEDSRVQSSQIFRSIVTQIHKKLTNHLENDNEYLVCIIRYFREKVNQDVKYSQQQLPSIPDNPFNELIAHFGEQQKLKQESYRELANYVDLELLPILQQELQWKTFQNYKSSVSKRISQIEIIVKNVGNKYKDYGKTYMEAQKQAIKNKECDKDLYTYEFPYIQEALELHEELKALGKEVMEFVQIALVSHAERLFKIQKFLQMFLEKAGKLGIMAYKEDLFSQFKAEQLSFDKLLSPQDSNYIIQQMNDESQTDENQIALVLKYIEQFTLIEPKPNPLLLAKFQGQYEKSANKIKQVIVTITIDKNLVIYTKKPLFILSLHSLQHTYINGILHLVETKKALIGNTKTKIQLRCEEEINNAIQQYQN